MDLLRLLPILRSGGTPAGTERVVRWLGAWAANDPRIPHWHLGPPAVAPAWQGRGVGGRLITQGLAAIETGDTVAWLETDKPVNVCRYRRFGFNVVSTRRVLGVTNWSMQRTVKAVPAERGG